MAYRLNGQINVQIRPIEMVGRGSHDVEDLLNRSRLEPRKLGIRKRQFLIINQHPDAMAGNIRDLSP
jgi:hypothetical protein